VRAWLAVTLPTLVLSGARPGSAEHSILSEFDLNAPPDIRWELPRFLNEISGLAYTPEGELLAHDDERAVIYQLDPWGQRVVKRFGFGAPVVRGDFEGIAAAEGRIFLVTSDGVLYEGREGRDGEHVAFALTRTGVGRRCEVEGLSYEPSDRTLLLACKEPRTPALRGKVAIFRWSLERRMLLLTPRPLVPLRGIAGGLPSRGFHPSDLVREPRSGHYLLVAAQEHAVAELTPGGELLQVVRLRAAYHRQAEGITFAPDGSLLVSDEAAGKRATLSVYRRHAH
jgi:uncharacterized protein YjiK